MLTGQLTRGSSWSVGPLQPKRGFTHCSKRECCVFGVVWLWLLLPHTPSQACPTPLCFTVLSFSRPARPHSRAWSCPFPDSSISDTRMSCGANGPATFSPFQAFLFVGFCPSLYGRKFLLSVLCPLQMVRLAQNVTGGI